MALPDFNQALDPDISLIDWSALSAALDNQARLRVRSHKEHLVDDWVLREDMVDYLLGLGFASHRLNLPRRAARASIVIDTPAVGRMAFIAVPEREASDPLVVESLHQIVESLYELGASQEPLRVLVALIGHNASATLGRWFPNLAEARKGRPVDLLAGDTARLADSAEFSRLARFSRASLHVELLTGRLSTASKRGRGLVAVRVYKTSEEL
jgi:hypothetical protein